MAQMKTQIDTERRDNADHSRKLQHKKQQWEEMGRQKYESELTN